MRLSSCLLSALCCACATAPARPTPVPAPGEGGLVLRAWLEPQSISPQSLGIPAGRAVQPGDLWLALDDLAYPLVADEARQGMLRVLTPAVRGQASDLLRSPGPGVLEVRGALGQQRGSQPSGAGELTGFTLSLVARGELLQELGASIDPASGGAATFKVNFPAQDLCQPLDQSKVRLTETGCLFDRSEKCRADRPAPLDDRNAVHLGPVAVSVRIGTLPCRGTTL